MSLISTAGLPSWMRVIAPGGALGVAALTLVLGAPALASGTGAPRVFKGGGPDGLTVSLSRPYSHSMRHFRYRVTLRCSDGSSFTDNAFVDDVAVTHGGHFRSRFRDDRGATISHVTGRIVGHGAHGIVSITERYSSTPNAQGNYPLDPHGTVTCSSGTVHWRARAAA